MRTLSGRSRPQGNGVVVAWPRRRDQRSGQGKSGQVFVKCLTVEHCQQKMWSPLHYASKFGHLDVVELLVESGADTTCTSKDDKVPLCAAAAAGHYNVVSYLLKKEHDTLNLMDDRIVSIVVHSKNSHCN